MRAIFRVNPISLKQIVAMSFRLAAMGNAYRQQAIQGSGPNA